MLCDQIVTNLFENQLLLLMRFLDFAKNLDRFCKKIFKKMTADFSRYLGLYRGKEVLTDVFNEVERIRLNSYINIQSCL